MTEEHPFSAAPKSPHRWLLLMMVGLGLLLVTVDITILLTALPVLTHELHASAAEGLWIVNAYPLFSTGLLLGAGTLGDRIGHRRMYLVGLVIFGLASLMAAYAGSVAVLVLARVLQAMGASAMLPATLALIRVGFADERERALAISVWACLSLVGAILGPLLGGWLLGHFHWGALFLVNVPIIAVAWLGTWFVAPEQRNPNADPWDLPSSVLALLALSSLVLAIKTATHPPIDLGVLGAALAAGLVAGLAFVRRQRQLTHPLLDFSLFRNPAFAAGVLGAVSVTFTTGGVLLGVSQRFQWVAGYTPLQSGLLASVLFIGTLPSSILGGLWLHHIGLRRLIAGGLAVGALGMLVAAQALPWHPSGLPAAHEGLGWLVTGLLLAGLGLGATISVASTAIVESAPPHRAGMASSVEEVAYEFGALLSIALLGSLLTGLYTVFVQLPPGVDAAAARSISAALDIVAASGGALPDHLAHLGQHLSPTLAEPGLAGSLPAEDAAARQEAASLLVAAQTAFDRSYTVVMHLGAVILTSGAWITNRLLRPRQRAS
ncbi:MFS transporter [Lautropia mirabilis ATCC 51599]|jgi:MFS transporter|uniref:Transporter, major facilitator family protein n=1 Tax=Lautropia mirabilis ATCC 51599 TaxID=887898 RepID=E7RWJ4_9BURK|nr:MFS transporter [Lautropia mirabilis]EFV95098.1 transporter, major facilitator family protein [Lautropia mirabilis ATCC 51599]VEH02012.1 Antiseptic resistance protein [Lautropia mirabilis]